MAVVDASAPFAEVINSLDESKIPDKLRCPGCHKFLLDGWKLVCCDQTICGSCYSTITNHCPVCEHRPMSQDLAKPNKALRNTAKAYLKTAEKKLADERAKANSTNGPALAVGAPTPSFETPTPAPINPQVEENTANEKHGLPPAIKVEESTPLTQHALTSQLQLSTETSAVEPAPTELSRQEASLPLNEIEERAGGLADVTPQETPAVEEKKPVDEESKAINGQDQTGAVGASDSPFNVGGNVNASGFPNMMNVNMNTGFNNSMDYAQMMQYMSSNGMGNLNNMMGMPNMGMNPMTQGMFGGFGGPTMGMAGMNGLNSMNGMNMGMNFNPGQGMYGAGWNGQNSNMWNGPQSNNPNAFSNGMGGDFGSNSGYGYNPSQQGNFHQHQYPNGDFQGGYQNRGYGRGRGRARGSYGRGRGGYGQALQGNYTNYQHPYEQQQQEIQNMQAQMTTHDVSQAESSGPLEPNDRPTTDEEPTQLNFAPGGQDEVQEALGDDYAKAETATETETPAPGDAAPEADAKAEAGGEVEGETIAKDKPLSPDEAEITHPIRVLSPTTYEGIVSPTAEIPSIATEPEILESPMPPPLAPLGPAAQYADPGRDYGFRGRGHSRMPSRGRGSFHAVNGHPVSPVKPVPAPPFHAPIEPKGTGVVGAPTGPKAMRALAVSGPAPPVRGRGGGFQIIGRASMTPRGTMSVASEKSRSVTPTNTGRDEPDHNSRSSSHQRSRDDHHNSRRETDAEEDRDRRRERRSRHSRHDEYRDHDIQDEGKEKRRSVSPDEQRRSSHRKEKDRDRYSSSTKHRSSRSRRHRDEADHEADHDMDNHNAESRPSRDNIESESRSSRRDRDRDRDRKRDHHASRSSRYEEEDREDSHRERRKRSRRDHENGGEIDEVEEESRHRSRRHKREHGHDHHEESVNGRKGSERSSAAATPVEREPEKDMHTLEREARNRERMLKEQQRRENAMNAERGNGSKRHGVAGGRRVSYKYEDETQSAMVEQEREAARWR